MSVKPKLLIKPEFGADVCLNCFISTIKDQKTLHYGNHQILLESKNNSNH